MNRKLATFGLALLAAGLSGAARAQDIESLFVDPTPLAEAAAASDARILVVGDHGRIDTDDAAAEIVAVEIVAADGNRERGVRVTLESEDRNALVYIDVDQALQVRNELTRFDGTSAVIPGCTGVCIHGIARCRPSQQIAQALCPAVYSASSGETGVHLSTPRGAFQFPAVTASAFAATLDAAIASAAAESDSQR